MPGECFGVDRCFKHCKIDDFPHISTTLCPRPCVRTSDRMFPWRFQPHLRRLDDVWSVSMTPPSHYPVNSQTIWSSLSTERQSPSLPVYTTIIAHLMRLIYYGALAGSMILGTGPAVMRIPFKWLTSAPPKAHTLAYIPNQMEWVPRVDPKTHAA